MLSVTIRAGEECSGGLQPAGGLKAAATLLLLLICLAPARSQPAPQNPDLDRIRGDIARLRKKLDDVRAQTQTAEQELEEVTIELDIRTRELEVAQRVEADLQQ